MKDDLVLGQISVYTKLTHSQVILPLVGRLLEDTGLKISDMDLIAVANGPGSYTGLRIGVALVKGLCYDGRKCIGVSTLEALAFNCAAAKARIFCVMQARPGIIYFGAYDSDGESVVNAMPDGVISAEKLKEYISRYCGEVILTGDGAENIKNEFFADEERVRFSPPAQRLQSAAGVCQAALRHADEAGEACRLNARYLQATKAEKDLSERMDLKA